MGRQIKLNQKYKEILTLEEGWRVFVKRNELKQLAEATKIGYEDKVYRKFFNWLYGKQIVEINQITQDVIEDYALYLQNTGIKLASVNSYLRAARTFVNYMFDKGHINRFKIELTREKERVVKIYTSDDIKILTTRPKSNSFAEYRNYIICCILASSGIRVNSLVTIQNQDVDLLNGILTLRHNKNGHIQIIHLSSSIKDILEEYMDVVRGEATDALIVNYLGQPITTRAVNKAIRKYANKRGIYVEKYIHSFRYWYGISLAKQDVGAFTIMSMMGHRNIKTSQGYIERAGFDVKNRVNEINPFEQLKTRKRSIKLS